jgi:guanosine-3',5'-bis(diphosphate) 3'-pyrophosphohydrolase
MKEYVLVLKAADAAARWHVDHRRKGATQEPYINHLLEVASLVAEATEGKDPELIAAALLHDAIEDQEVPAEIIERDFGPRVLALVKEVTDDKTLDKAARKRLQIEKANTKSQGAKVIKLADKTSNLRSVATSLLRRSMERSGGPHGRVHRPTGAAVRLRPVVSRRIGRRLRAEVPGLRVRRRSRPAL